MDAPERKAVSGKRRMLPDGRYEKAGIALDHQAGKGRDGYSWRRGAERPLQRRVGRRPTRLRWPPLALSPPALPSTTTLLTVPPLAASSRPAGAGPARVAMTSGSN